MTASTEPKKKKKSTSTELPHEEVLGARARTLHARTHARMRFLLMLLQVGKNIKESRYLCWWEEFKSKLREDHHIPAAAAAALKIQ